MIQEDIHISKKIHADIEKELSRIGILFRVFSRIKTDESLQKKLTKVEGKYSKDGKKIQDIFGVRVALYFPDDTEMAQIAIKKIFDLDEASSTIDTPGHSSFEATRHNLIFKLTRELIEGCSICKREPLVDDTFEVQLRTILSEGWHEVEHDLRYKHNSDWDKHDDLNRALNGIYASLETADWSMMKLFDELAYRHYKAEEWEQMLRTKFRIRFLGQLSAEVISYFNENHDCVKFIFQIPRIKLIQTIAEKNIEIPLNYDNIVHIINYYYYKNSGLTEFCPEPIMTHLDERL